MRDKLPAAARKIEIHRRELDGLRSRLEARRQYLFEMVVRCVKRNDEANATVYASEHAELTKVTQILAAGELALSQVVVRFESIKDVGEAVNHVTSASKILKNIGKDLSGLGPALEHATQDVSSVLGETLTELGNVAPSLRVDIETQSVEELLSEAKIYAEQKAVELKNVLSSEPDSAYTQKVLSQARRVALLASGEEETMAPETKPTFYVPSKHVTVEESVHRYLTSNAGNASIEEVCSALGITKNEFERAILSLALKKKHDTR